MRWLTWKEPPKHPPEFEGAGRILAEQLRPLFDRAVAEEAERDWEQEQTDGWTSALREGLFEVVRGFNLVAPLDFQVALVDRGNGLVFHAGDRKTLTLMYGEGRVVIESKSDYPRLQMPMSLRVWRAEDGELRFRAVPDSPVFPRPVMKQVEFQASVLRMACNQDFNGNGQC